MFFKFREFGALLSRRGHGHIENSNSKLLVPQLNYKEIQASTQGLFSIFSKFFICSEEGLK